MSLTEMQLTITSIIASTAILTLLYQRFFNSKNLDYSFHPIFEVKEFEGNNKEWTPKLCESSDPKSRHYCPDDHWFDIVNVSNGIAFEFRCYLVHEKEIHPNMDISFLENRVIQRSAFVKNGRFQYKLPKDAIPFRYYNNSSSQALILITEYQTVSRTSRYIQGIGLTTRPLKEESQISDWKRAIKISHPNVVLIEKNSWWKSRNKLIRSSLMKVKAGN